MSAQCADYNHLSRRGEHYTYYDPEGLGCILDRINSGAKKYVGCEVPGYLHRPNSSASCKPLALYALSSFVTTPDFIKEAKKAILSDKIRQNSANSVRESF